MLLNSAPRANLSNHPGVVTALAALPPATDPSWPFAAAAVGESVSAVLSDPVVLRDAADRCFALAQRHGCDAVSGASPNGEALAIATMVTHSLPRFIEGTPASCVLVLDGVLATGVSLHLAAERLVTVGAGAVRLAVLVDLGETGHSFNGNPVDEIGV